MEGNEVFQLTGHKDLIYDLAFSQDGQYILSGSKDKTAILWDMEGNQIRHFKGHKRSIRSVSFSPDGKYIAAASLDETATIWNLEEDSHFKLNGHKAAIYSIEFSPDGKHIVTGSADGTIKLWDLEGVELQTLSGHQGRVYTAIFSPDGKKIYSAGDDGKIKTWQTWYAFLASNDLYQLSPQEQFNYQLIDTPPITRDESDLTRTVTYNMEGNIQLLSKQNQQGIPPLSQRRWYLGYRYSCKAFLSPDLEEKISLQKKSISLAASHLSNLERIKRENPAFKNRRIGRGIFNSLSYFHANQAIWMLAKGNFEAAKLLSEKSRTYSTSEDAAFIIETKSALIFLFSDQWEEARQIVDKMKSITIDESMANLHKLVTYQDINTETPILQLVLEDIAFLQSHSIDHPDLERFKKLLITTP
jgi:dipeptidyl aminopeptidase/acylaminoacyl peptidase